MLGTPAFRLLLGARAVSTLCTGLDVVVLAWLVLALGGTPLHLAVMAALNAGAGVPAAFFGGPLIDRFSRRAVTVATELGRVLPLGAIPLLAGLGELRPWHVLVAGAVVSGLYSLSSASYSALLPELFDRTGLLRANGVWQAVSQVGVFIGAGLGGAAIPALGDTAPLLVGLAGRILTSGMLLAMPSRRTTKPATKRTSGLLFRDMTDAWRVLASHRRLLLAALFAAIPGSLISGINAVLPAFVKNDNGMGAAEYGLIDAAWGVGAFLAGLVCVKLSHAHDDPRYHTGSLLLTGCAMTLLATATNLPWSIALAAFVGGAALGSLVLFRAYVQAEAPPDYTGRILAVSQLVLSALWLAVALGLGTLTLILSVRMVIVCWGTAIICGGLTIHLLLRRYGTKEVSHAEGSD
ncbi:MFS transporter [Amycolatopsis sp. La24]|uniref:MFS transporter n=1 Tax=Amycolatopsis sp. La24 TaxID=3028304 RepID=UPI0023B1ADB6|nr:MFS transporter [Amycolatopsis sp. La24]